MFIKITIHEDSLESESSPVYALWYAVSRKRAKHNKHFSTSEGYAAMKSSDQ